MTKNLEQLREKAEAFIAASDRLDEIGLGIGGLMVHDPDAGRNHSVWSESTDYDHADTVLSLIDRVEAAEREAVAAKSVIAQHIVAQSFETSRTVGIAVDEAVRVVAKMLEADTDRRARDAEARAEAAEQAVERAHAVDALQRRDKGALYRRAEVAEGRLSAIGLVVDDLHATSAISQDVADQLTEALDGGE